MPSTPVRYRPMTTFAGDHQADNGQNKQEPVCSYPDQLIPRSWRKQRGSDFRSFNFSSRLSAELWGKLSEKPKEGAKRFFRLRASATSRQLETNTMSIDVAMPGRLRPHSEIFVGGDEERVAQFMASQMDNNSRNSSITGTASPRPMSRGRSDSDDSNVMMSGNMPTLRNERVVATGNGITVSIALAEPLLFLPGYDHSDPSTKKSTILRGHLHIKTTKAVKVKKVSICFRGQAQTDWPDGIPPKKVSFHDKKDIVTSGMIYFNQGDSSIVQNAYGAHYYKVANPAPLATTKEPKIYSVTTTTRELLKNGSTTTVNRESAKELKRLSLQSNQSRSFGKNEAAPASTQPQTVRNYRLFPPGDYLYSFEFPVDGSMPETIKSELGSVRYDLEAIVERSGAFRPNLLGSTEIEVIRTPAEGSLEQVEPIAISRNWEDQLHYDIVISGKSFPMGSQVPIAFKLTPLAKVECHRIKVYVTENIQHWTQDRYVHRLQPPKKVLLFEKRADTPSVSTYPGSSMRVTAGGGVPWDRREAASRGEEQVNQGVSSLLGNLSNDVGSGPTEMEFSVQLPSCHTMKGKDEGQKLHFDTTYENIQINHWIKIVMRLSKPDEKDPTKRRHFEISIDSPFHILSCKATQGNIFLPAYSDQSSDPVFVQDSFSCGCPGAPMSKRNSIVNLPALVDRPDISIDTNVGPDGRGLPRSFTSGSGGLSRPEQAHIAHEPSQRTHEQNQRDARPMHLIRAPSFAPPSFEELEPPPPLITPPPEYATIVGDSDRETVLTDYFNRLSYFEEHDDERGLGRVDVPLTPGGRVHRSMDVPREWVRLGDATVQ